MGKRIVFVDGSDSFIVRSIVKNLEASGHTCLTLDWSVDKIEGNKDLFSDVIIAYIDDISEVEPKALEHLMGLCIEENHGLYLMGHRDDLTELKKDYALTNIAGEFFRPINANDAADRIGKLMEGNPMNQRNHILVVDDSGVMLNTIQEWLGEKYRVSVVSSAMNAITFLSQSIPDLILLDYEMPGCSGPQLLEMLRADERTDDIPVIFLTGKDDQESVKKVLALKPEGYLLKNMPKNYILKQIDGFFIRNKAGE